MVKDLHVTLPVSGGQLASVPEIAEAARRAEALYGVSLLNDDVARNVVIKHLRKRGQQDWYTEPGCLLILGGIVVAGYIGYSMESPVSAQQVAGMVAAILAIPAGIVLGLWGEGRNSDKQAASVHFTAYIGLLNQAQRAGLTFQIPTEWGADADRASWELGTKAAPAPQPPSAPTVYPTGPDPRTAPVPPPTVAAQPGSWWPADAVIDPKFPVLPPAVLARHWTLAARARALGAPYGLDFLDEQVVRGLLTAQQRTVRRKLVWANVSALVLVAATMVGVLGSDFADPVHRRQFIFAIGGLVAVGALAAIPALRAHRTWRRSGLRDHADAYLDLLIEARAYGVPVPVPPAWLDVRNRIRKPS
ncbi:hypothetical protein [Streptomyces sp. CBMA156]|uniref:hypothetical protein n=1 Tax=Streptomyces sp. CBMA156 TaxID=1930280 RepID=UPI0016619210|nr:hypothetical protein [Streptomyces sp. CBMA156]MBD0670603.1 hypothetical protein [Streptomyces sp. CBMA156]